MRTNVVWINSWQGNMDVQKPAKEFSYLKPGTEIQEDKRVDALINDKPFAVRLYDWPMNSIFFLNLPENSIIILDNASFDKKSESEKISQLYKYRVYLLIFYYSAKKFKIYESWLCIKSKNFLTVQRVIT